MASLERYSQIIETILTEYVPIPYAYGDIQTETVFDRTHDHSLLVNVGWDKGQRIHGTLVHIDIIGEKLWIQRYGTEHEIAAATARHTVVANCRPAAVGAEVPTAAPKHPSRT